MTFFQIAQKRTIFYKICEFLQTIHSEILSCCVGIDRPHKKKRKKKFKTKFVLTFEELTSFNVLKKVFIKAFMFRHFFFDSKIFLKTNASKFVLFDIIFQLFLNDGKGHFIAYGFGKMIPFERNYDVEEQEMLIIVSACKKGRHYVKKSKFFVRMLIDHVNFRIFLITKTFNRRKTRGGKRLSRFDFSIEYRANKKNFANESSRRRNYEEMTLNQNRKKIDFILKYIINDISKCNIFKLQEWALMTLNALTLNDSNVKKNFFRDKKSQSDRKIKKNKIFSFFEIKKMTDKKSKNNHFSNKDLLKSITSFNALISFVKNVVESLSNFDKISFFATMKRVLKKREKKSFFKSKLREIDSKSRLHRLVNIIECENLMSRDGLKNVSKKNSIFAIASLKLRIVLQMLQKIDFFATRVRFQVVKLASMKQSGNDDESEKLKKVFVFADKDEIVSFIDIKGHMKDEFLCGNDKGYVFSKLFKKELLKQNHDDLFVEHFDHKRTFDFIKKKYFGTNMKKDVKEYVDFCIICHRIKFVRHRFHDFLKFLSMSNDFKKNGIMNFIIDFSSNKGRKDVFDSILILINRYTKFTKNISIKKTGIVKNLADVIIDAIITQFDKSMFIITNRDFFFISNYWSIFCYHLGIRLRYNTVYQSQTNEQTKKKNQILEIYLKSYVNYQQNDGIKGFNITEFVYNNNLNFVVKKTSFEMMFDSKIRFENAIQENFKKNIFAIRNRALNKMKMKTMLKHQGKQFSKKARKNYDRKRIDVSFKFEDLIYLNAKNIKSIRFFKKLDYKYYDLYKIRKFIKKIVYRFEFFVIMNDIHDVFHVSLLEKIKKDKKNVFVIGIKDDEEGKIKKGGIQNGKKEKKIIG